MVIYQYDNTALTSYKTIRANSSQLLPTSTFGRGDFVFSGVPTDIIEDEGAYMQETTLIYGTEFTDPYGTVYTSPTPVWIYHDIHYATPTTTQTVSIYTCPAEEDFQIPGEDDVTMTIYPSGKLFPSLNRP